MSTDESKVYNNEELNESIEKTVNNTTTETPNVKKATSELPNINNFIKQPEQGAPTRPMGQNPNQMHRMQTRPTGPIPGQVQSRPTGPIPGQMQSRHTGPIPNQMQKPQSRPTRPTVQSTQQANPQQTNSQNHIKQQVREQYIQKQSQNVPNNSLNDFWNTYNKNTNTNTNGNANTNSNTKHQKNEHQFADSKSVFSKPNTDSTTDGTMKNFMQQILSHEKMIFSKPCKNSRAFISTNAKGLSFILILIQAVLASLFVVTCVHGYLGESFKIMNMKMHGLNLCIISFVTSLVISFSLVLISFVISKLFKHKVTFNNMFNLAAIRCSIGIPVLIIAIGTSLLNKTVGLFIFIFACVIEIIYIICSYPIDNDEDKDKCMYIIIIIMLLSSIVAFLAITKGISIYTKDWTSWYIPK